MKNPTEIEKETAFELMFGANGKVTNLVGQVMKLTENIENKSDVSTKPLMTLKNLLILLKEIRDCFVGRKISAIFNQSPETKKAIHDFFIHVAANRQNSECEIIVRANQISIRFAGEKQEYLLHEGAKSITMYEQIAVKAAAKNFYNQNEKAEKLVGKLIDTLQPRVNVVRRFIYDYKENLKKTYNAVLEAHKIEVPALKKQLEASN
jgi:Txe/YoeB family toxin of Txe-Axe toxin-antitoxin module